MNIPIQYCSESDLDKNYKSGVYYRRYPSGVDDKYIQRQDSLLILLRERLDATFPGCLERVDIYVTDVVLPSDNIRIEVCRKFITYELLVCLCRVLESEAPEYALTLVVSSNLMKASRFLGNIIVTMKEIVISRALKPYVQRRMRGDFIDLSS